jgi:hemerythrin
VQEHIAFTQKIVQFNEDFMNGRMGLTVEIMNFLCNWLLDHVKNSDLEFGEYARMQTSSEKTNSGQTLDG